MYTYIKLKSLKSSIKLESKVILLSRIMKYYHSWMLSRIPIINEQLYLRLKLQRQ